MRHPASGLVFALLAVALAAPVAQVTDDVPAPPQVVDGVLVWTLQTAFSRAAVVIHAPGGAEIRRAFLPGDRLAFDPASLEQPLADGFYIYDLLIEAPDAGEGASRRARTQLGAFEVRGGQAVPSAMLDQVINDELIVKGSVCVGLDCVIDESFGFDTIRLKENNLRINFTDTSSSGTFPTTDWEIKINDSFDGGASYFQVGDVTNGRTPFHIRAGAPSYSLFVSDAGRIGLGTATPSTRLHMVIGDTPTIRLDQDGSSGFTAQAWDVAGNEASFFVRDATNGGLLPFRIHPSTPTHQLVLTPDGVSINKARADTGVNLDVAGVARVSNRLLVGFGDDFSTAAANTNFEVGGANNGIVRFRTNMRVDGSLLFSDDFTADPFVFRVLNTATTPAMRLMQLTNAGNLDISGTLMQGSDVATKEHVVPVDADAILLGVATLPLATWEYIADTDDAVHLGPMSQDFATAFGLGSDSTRIASVDADGVALASIQALLARVEADRARIAALEAEVVALAARLAQIDAWMVADRR